MNDLRIQHPILSKYLPYLLMLLLIGFTSCSSDDDGDDEIVVEEPWEQEVEDLTAAMQPYSDFQAAQDYGWNIEATDHVPGMGHHYINGAYMDNTFVMNQPEAILVADLGNGMEVLGVEYLVGVEDPSEPGDPPAGFSGDDDVWVWNSDVNAWTLHVWIFYDNPAGIFNATNSNVP